MSHVFISYSKKNKGYALKLADHLIASGFDVWIDDRIDYGAAWEDAIQKAIEDCAAFVVIMTTESRESPWVRTECEYAWQKHKPVFPLLLEGNVFFRFVSVQYVDVTDGSLPPEAFLRELAEHAPRKQEAGEDVTSPEVSEEKTTPPPEPQEPQRTPPPVPLMTPAATFQPARQSRARGRLVIVLGLLAALLVVAFVVIYPQINQSDISYGQTLEGELTEDAPTRSYTFRGAPGDTIYIKLTAEDFDCYLSLLDKNGSEIASDDDTGGEHDSLIEGFTLPADGVYTIVALSYPYRESGEVATGAYSLTLRLLENVEVAAAPTETETPAPTEPVPTETPTEDTNSSSVSAVTSNSEWSPIIQTFNEIEMALVPPGCFNGQNGETCIEAPFWIDRLEVSNSVFAVRPGAVVGAASAWTDDNQPRTNVTASESMEFCDWRGGRLPTQEEWEYAARGPEAWVYPWGDEFDPDHVIYEDNSDGQPDSVEERPEGASWVGALNMSGNVWEWTATETDEGLLIKRGGSYEDPETSVTASTSVPDYVSTGYANTGFRCLIDYKEEILAIITYPEPGEMISSDTDIFGTALYTPFSAESYTVEISGGQYGDEWSQLDDAHTGSVINDWLEMIQYDSLEPGDYRIRLRIAMLDGEDVYSGEVPFIVEAAESENTDQTGACSLDWFFGNEYALEGDCPSSEALQSNGIVQRFDEATVISFEVRPGVGLFLLLKDDGTFFNTERAWNLDSVEMESCIFETTAGVVDALSDESLSDEGIGCTNQTVQEESFHVQISDSSLEFVVYVAASNGAVYRLVAASADSESEGVWQRIR